jgi:hypothetical protein
MDYMADPARVKRSSKWEPAATAMRAILGRLRPKEVGGFVAYEYDCANATNPLDVYSLLSTRESISLKGDFLLQVFFLNHLPPSP